MDIRSLKIFVEIASHGGLNRAAAKLNIAQSALSRRLALLEHEIGTTLLERGKRGVQLTGAGALLLDRSEALLRHFDQVQAEMLALAKEPRGELALGLPPSLQPQMSRALALLRNRFPGVRIRSWTATSIDLRTMLLAGKFDLIVFASINSDPLLNLRPLTTEVLHLIGPPGMILEDVDDALRCQPLILTSHPNSARQLVDSWAAARGTELNIGLEVNDVSLMLRLVEEGAGLTILPRSALAIRDTPFANVAIGGLELMWAVASAKEKPLSIASKCAIDIIHETMRVDS